MMKFLFIALTIVPQVLLCQDLVRNGGFEKYHELPDDCYDWEESKYWHEIINIVDSSGPLFHQNQWDFFYQTAGSDFKDCNRFNRLNYHSGKGVAGLNIAQTTWHPHTNFKYRYRGYMSTKLTRPMIVGNTYSISFWMTNGKTDTSRASWYAYGISCDGLGIYLSTVPIGQVEFYYIEKDVQLKIPGNVWDTVWRKYEFEFTADSAYEYLTFGSWLPDSQITFEEGVPGALSGPNPTVQAYYFLDDFKVLPNFLYVVGDTNICRGNPAVLSAVNEGPHSWAISSSPNEIFSLNSIVTVYPDSTTSYLVYGSEDTASFTVFVKDVGIPDLGNDTVFCLGDELLLTTGLEDADFQWSDGTTTDNLIAMVEGKYWVRAEKQGCVFQDSIELFTKYCDCNVSIPNAFTPNNDGLNDVFIPQYGCRVIRSELLIYNRWGDRVFKSSSLQAMWDGNCGNGPCPAGAYVYRLRYVLANGTEGDESGRLIILR